MWTYLIGPVLAFLPSRWRTAHLRDWPVNWPRATMLSGILEGALALVALVGWYSLFVARNGAAIGAAFPEPYAGPMGFLSLAGHPLTWLIGYLGAEGAVRTLSGLATEEAPGSLLFVALDNLIRFVRSGRWGHLPALVADEVTRGEGGWALQVASCRPKPHWKFPLTIRYQDEFFRVRGEEKARRAGARPHIYLLERLPGNEIIKGLEPYDPNDTLEQRNPPGFFATVMEELRKRWAR